MPTSEVVISTPEERQREIDELRAHLGLRIEEPASAGEAQGQMSALVINLGLSQGAAGDGKAAHKAEGHSLAMPAAVARIRLSSRPIEERKYVPPLAAPGARPPYPRPGESPVHGSASIPEPPVRPRVPLAKMARIVLVVALLLAATVVAIVFVGR